MEYGLEQGKVDTEEFYPKYTWRNLSKYYVVRHKFYMW
jgi:hypothetical protein